MSILQIWAALLAEYHPDFEPLHSRTRSG